jgi:hypothetical protein
MTTNSMPKAERRLAAVMAVDVVGYSRLMGRDEGDRCGQGPVIRTSPAGTEIVENRAGSVPRETLGTAARCGQMFAAMVQRRFGETMRSPPRGWRARQRGEAP